MIETVRARLTIWYVASLAAVLIMVGGLIYVLLARALYVRIDENLTAVSRIAMTSLANDLTEGQDVADAARSTAAELASSQQMLLIYDAGGALLAEEGRDDDLEVTLPALDSIPRGEPALVTVEEPRDPTDRHRLAFRRATIDPGSVDYVIVIGSSLERTDEELESLREILWYVGPLALVIAGIGGWFLARHSLSPVVAMVDRARRIGAGNLGERLPVGNRRDELGRLALTLNDLLGRLEQSMVQQRQFMADASHELRTPVATARTAASVALQQASRGESEYREALDIIEQQTSRLSRIVDDMFTLARADAGNYPMRRTPMYLDEIVEEVARGARVLAGPRHVSVQAAAVESAAFTGDEDLIRRLLVNLVDNAVRHSPPDTTVTMVLEANGAVYTIGVSDGGPGIPPHVQPHIFERFYRGDAARSREVAYDGAGLGLALARWIAREHGGDVVLADSSASGSTFVITLPRPA
ncbi:MAG TPA: ATP-binding protein [Vicinamibacterales bacterium]|nr:ATP-binding protein [Vicinamibacterales bacterium]